MSHDELLEWLFKAGTGVLGWPPEVTLAADMTDIMTAYEARLGLIGDVLKSVFGSGDSKAVSSKGEADFRALPKIEDVSPALLDAMFG